MKKTAIALALIALSNQGNPTGGVGKNQGVPIYAQQQPIPMMPMMGYPMMGGWGGRRRDRSSSRNRSRSRSRRRSTTPTSSSTSSSSNSNGGDTHIHYHYYNSTSSDSNSNTTSSDASNTNTTDNSTNTDTSNTTDTNLTMFLLNAARNGYLANDFLNNLNNNYRNQPIVNTRTPMVNSYDTSNGYSYNVPNNVNNQYNSIGNNNGQGYNTYYAPNVNTYTPNIRGALGNARNNIYRVNGFNSPDFHRRQDFGRVLFD